MADVAWSDIEAFFPALSEVAAGAQTAILAYVNTAFNVANLGGESSPSLKLARIGLAAAHGELALPGSELGDVSSETVSADSLSVSYAPSSASSDLLAGTAGWAFLDRIIKTSPARLGFVTGVC